MPGLFFQQQQQDVDDFDVDFLDAVGIAAVGHLHRHVGQRAEAAAVFASCLLYTSPSPRD